jgi:serine/threonine protein kinase
MPQKICPPGATIPTNAVDQDDTALTCRMANVNERVLSPEELSAVLKLPAAELGSKQERDFVLGALLMRGKHLSERTLRRLLKSWTPFGELPLRDFLLGKRLVSENALSQAELETQRFLESFEQQSSRVNGAATTARRTARLMEQIDPAGRVAKVFGLSQIPKEVFGEELRTFRTQFRLLHKLGQGGLGAVWAAVDTSLNRLVAIKEILGPSETSSIAIARFRREAEITGRLDHPSIVPLHVLGKNEADGRQFYVMRFVGNETLEDAIRDYHDRRETGQASPMAFHRLLAAFGSICQAIAYAHSRQVIHRDLKPQNIALDDFGQVIVLDWGLAKVMSNGKAVGPPGGTSVDLDHTMAGQVAGTPMYMAPEQASGRVDDIDEQTDVYGLGAILYAILTGYAPHEPTHESLAPGSQISALLDAIVDRSITPPRRLNSEVPAGLEAICLKAISKDRYLRYPSASALSEDFQRWTANEPITALRQSALTRIQRWARQHQTVFWLLTVLAMFLLSAGAFGAFTSYQARETREQISWHIAADDTRELQSRLTHEIQTLSELVRFLAAEPAVQDVVNVRVRKRGVDERQIEDRLRGIFQGVMHVHPSSVAVTLGINEPITIGKPIRVESQTALHGALRSDLREFFSRHYPAIKKLDRREVYVGMPGRFRTESQGAGAGAPSAAGDAEIIGRCLVAGVPVYDDATESRVGALVLECDLERLLEDFLHTAFHKAVEITLTDEKGLAVMRYSRDDGLAPVASQTGLGSDEEAARLFFQSKSRTATKVASSRLSFARVPLSQADPERFMGLIMRFGGDEAGDPR